MTLIIRPCDLNDPYGKSVASFLAREFPANLTDRANVVDAITEAFIATSQTRQGPQPTPESQVALRNVIRHWVELNEPIAVLVPWGSKKAVNTHELDVAELMGLRQLEALHDRVKRIYQPGVIINVMVENLGGNYIWYDDPASIEAMYEYTDAMLRMGSVLEHPWMVIEAESKLADRGEYFQVAEKMRSPLHDHLFARVLKDEPDDFSLATAHALGWKGTISDEMIQYYMGSYAKTYPHDGKASNVLRLARYFAQSYARYKLKAKMKYQHWGQNYIQISFTSPIPGAPVSLVTRNLYYRTLPMNFARTHIPAWRARGYLAVTESGVVIPKLGTAHEDLGLHSLNVEFDNGRDSVIVDASYQVR